MGAGKRWIERIFQIVFFILFVGIIGGVLIESWMTIQAHIPSHFFPTEQCPERDPVNIQVLLRIPDLLNQAEDTLRRAKILDAVDVMQSNFEYNPIKNE